MSRGQSSPDGTLAREKFTARKAPFNPEPLMARVNELLTESGRSAWAVSEGAGLDHQALYRIRNGARPDMSALIMLANEFRINPNELLSLAGWPTLKVFDVVLSNGEVAPEITRITMMLAGITDQAKRKDVANRLYELLLALMKF